MLTHPGGIDGTGPEQRYQRLLEAVTDYVFHVRVEDGRAVETVHASNCEAVTGYTPQEFADNPMLWIAMVPAGRPRRRRTTGGPHPLGPGRPAHRTPHSPQGRPYALGAEHRVPSA